MITVSLIFSFKFVPNQGAKTHSARGLGVPSAPPNQSCAPSAGLSAGTHGCQQRSESSEAPRHPETGLGVGGAASLERPPKSSLRFAMGKLWVLQLSLLPRSESVSCTPHRPVRTLEVWRMLRNYPPLSRAGSGYRPFPPRKRTGHGRCASWDLPVSIPASLCPTYGEPEGPICAGFRAACQKRS